MLSLHVRRAYLIIDNIFNTIEYKHLNIMYNNKLC